MTATISLDGLWICIQSLSKTNKKWLSDKLLEELYPNDGTIKTKEEILEGIVQGAKEAKNGQTHPIEELWSQL
ncbi:MAG: surface protein [Bacteroidales bacterium]|nr:surface protein [Bacteroidales bacterium]